VKLALKFSLAMLFFSSIQAVANCIEVVDLSTELPPRFISKAGVVVSYEYDLLRDEYQLSWRSKNVDGGPFGPFPLTMSCGTPALKWESSEFLLFERGCGTFCWYVKIFALDPLGLPYQKIDRPLAFHQGSNLLAYYHSQDVIHVKNLASGQEQSIATELKCDFYSGLCFSDISFGYKSLEYTWRSTGEIFTVDLSPALFDHGGTK
jgi:hypothetical protein